MRVGRDMSTKIHIGIATRDLAKAIPFYETLFGAAPVKRESAYAKFDVADPPVNFTLNQTLNATPPHTGPQHFGIQVGDRETVVAAKQRLEAVGIPTMTEENVTCCYALQDKVWATDPDGHRWEVFVTHADTAVHSLPGRAEAGMPKNAGAAVDASATDEPCCEPSCCK